MPVLVAPMSAMLMAHKEGEPATARAAVKANTSMVHHPHQQWSRCMDACFYVSMFACNGRQTLHACHSEVVEIYVKMLQHMQAACSD